VAVREWGEDTPSEPESSEGDKKEEDEDEEEGEVTPPPHSLPPEDLSPLSDLFSQQARVSLGTRWSKRPQTETGPSTGPPLWSGLALVSSD
jgi:hypothetical protein